jgi:predicted alpha/beta hydrolase
VTFHGAPSIPVIPTHEQDITLTADDGYRLAATIFPTHGSDWIVVGSATAVPRRFYRRFARYAQARGVNVITTDYRGIGGSRPPGGLRGFMPDYVDWSRQDLAAAVAYASDRGPSYLVGHSLAGHAIGLLPDPYRLRAAWVAAGGAGWHGYMPSREQRKVWLLWNVIGPVATRLLGYQPMKAFGIGEDIPVSVYRRWKQWCRFPHYFFDDPDPVSRDLVAGFAGVGIPIAAVNATDDWWALPASRDAFFKGYTGATVEAVTVTPAELGVREVGHMGYFREHVGRALWPRTMDWLQMHGLRTTPVTASTMPQAE